MCPLYYCAHNPPGSESGLIEAKNVPLLDVKELSVHFKTDENTIRAVDDISFSVMEGETLGIVGESGCGKTVTSLSILRLVPSPGKIVSGKILFNNTDLLMLPESSMIHVRGHKISMVFQDPMTSLNPVFTIGNQIEESILLHERVGKHEARKRTIEMLELVKIPDAVWRYNAYPHQLSGGMRQRVMIAMALACKPALLIADEPTTALDVTIQSQILELLKEIQEKLKTSIILITHNLGLVAEICDRVVVMYAGRIVEKADVKPLFKSPKHPYTWGLLQCIPRLDVEKTRLIPIPGQLPSITEKPSACTFAPRCGLVQTKCRESEPELLRTNGNHESRCYYYDRIEESK